MNNMRCSVCGGKLLPSKDDKTMLVCENCNNLFDLNQYHKVTVELDDASINEKEKDRLIKNAYKHIDNKQFNYANKTLDKLEYEYPDEPEIIELKKYCNNSYRAYKEELEVEFKIKKIESKINSYINDEVFWKPESKVIDCDKLEDACLLLDDIEKYNLDTFSCMAFRAAMYTLYNDTRHKRIKAIGNPSDELHRFHKLFYIAEELKDREIKLFETKNKLKIARHRFNKHINHTILQSFGIGILLIIFAIILFFNVRIFKIILPMGILGILIIGFTILFLKVYDSKSSPLRKFLINTNQEEANEQDIIEDIAEIEKEIENIKESSQADLEEYVSITATKSLKWRLENKGIIKNYEGA